MENNSKKQVKASKTIFSLVFCIGVWATLFACKRQPKPENPSTSPQENTIGKPIAALGGGVLILFQDSKDNYWFAHEGIVKFDGETFVQFDTGDGLYANRVRGIQEDHLGNIYFDTGAGINRFDGQKIEKLVLSTDTSKVWKLEPNDLWFAGNWNENGVYRFDGTQLFHLEFPKHKFEREFYSKNPFATFSPYDVYETYKDSKGHIWMGTSTFGACRFDGESLKWVSEREMTEIDGGSSPGVRSILEDNEGYYWFSSNVNHKFLMVDGGTKTETNGLPYQQLPGIDNAQEADMSSSPMSILQDDGGNIWMAMYEGGVWKYDGKKLVHFPVMEGGAEVLLFSIYKDNHGGLWLGTHHAGVYQFNGKTFEKFEPQKG